MLKEMMFSRTVTMGIQSDDALKIRGEMLSLRETSLLHCAHRRQN